MHNMDLRQWPPRFLRRLSHAIPSAQTPGAAGQTSPGEVRRAIEKTTYHYAVWCGVLGRLASGGTPAGHPSPWQWPVMGFVAAAQNKQRAVRRALGLGQAGHQGTGSTIYKAWLQRLGAVFVVCGLAAQCTVAVLVYQAARRLSQAGPHAYLWHIGHGEATVDGCFLHQIMGHVFPKNRWVGLGRFQKIVLRCAIHWAWYSHGDLFRKVGLRPAQVKKLAAMHWAHVALAPENTPVPVTAHPQATLFISN